MNEELKEKFAAWGLRLKAAQETKLELFAARLKESNAVMNLVSKADEPELWTRHICDSLAAVPVLRRYVTSGALIADSGTGAGFPGAPLAAALEEFRFELLDSNGKRCAFLAQTLSDMGAANAAVFQRRVGEGPRTARYSAVLERAMGRLENVLPQCLNMVTQGGVFLAWQSAAQLAQERPVLERALLKARAAVVEKAGYRLPGEKEDRFILVIKRTGR